MKKSRNSGDTGGGRWWRTWNPDDLSEADRRNHRRVSLWASVWAISTVIAVVVLGPWPGGLAATPVWAWCLVLAPLLPGVMALRAYMRFLHEADELIRKIHLEALAAGFGAATVVGMAFILLAQLAGPLEDSGAITLVAMWSGYTIRMAAAKRRYDA